MFKEEQIEALEEAKTYLQEMRFKAPVRSKKKLEKGIENKFEMKIFQKGHLITINAIILLQGELDILFQVPILKTYLTTQDELERLFSIIRGLGSHSQHPTPLQYLQRLCKHIKMKMLESDNFDLDITKKYLSSIKDEQNNADFSISVEDLPETDFDTLEIERIQEIASKITSTFENVEQGFLDDLKRMYMIFNHVHPKDGLQDKNNLLTGE